MAFRIVGDAEALAAATSSASFEMSTPTLCATVDRIFSQSSSCLGGMTPRCPFRPLGKRGVVKLQISPFRLARYTTHPLPPPACVADRPAAPNPAGSDGENIRQGALSAQLRRLRPLSATSAKRRHETSPQRSRMRKLRSFPTGLSHRSNWDLKLPKPMDTAPP